MMAEIAVKDLNDLPLTMTVDQVAEILQLDRKVVYRIVKEEKLAIRCGAKRLIIPKHKLIAYLNQ